MTENVAKNDFANNALIYATSVTNSRYVTIPVTFRPCIEQIPLII